MAERRYLQPGRFTNRVFNPLVAWLVRRGVSLAGAAILEVRGRRSGEPRTTPVNPLRWAGERYLLAPRGETEWVRNIRVAGGGALIRRRGREEFVVDELADDEVRAVAPGFPVFRISPRTLSA